MAGVTGTETLGYLVPLCTVLSPWIAHHSGAKRVEWAFQALGSSLPPRFFHFCFPLVYSVSFDFCDVFLGFFLTWCVSCPPPPRLEGTEGQEPSVDRLAFDSGSTGCSLLAGLAAGVTEVQGRLLCSSK